MATSSTKVLKVTCAHTLYVGLGFAVLFPANSSAETFQQSLTLPLSIEYETNPRLLTNNEKSVRRTILKPDYSLMLTQGNDQFSADFSLNIERSSNQSASEEREDPNLVLAWTRSYERGEFGITANFSEQSTRISEFDDTGLVSADNTRQTRSIGGHWNTALSERYNFALNADVTKVEFDSQTGSLNDYDNKSINARLGYSVNEQIESYAQISLSRFEPATSSKTNFRSLDLGAAWAISEQFNIDGNIGINKTSGSSSESGWQAMLNAEYMTARTRTNIGLSRSRSPSGAGIINESNQLSAGWTYNLSEKENLGLDFNYRENLTSNQSDTVLLSANYTRALAQDWDFKLSAAHRNRDDENSNVSSNILTATIIYKLPDF